MSMMWKNVIDFTIKTKPDKHTHPALAASGMANNRILTVR